MPRPLPTPIASGEIPLNAGTAFVYQAYGAGENLLYVGVTDNIEQRLAAHRRTAVWFLQASRVAWAEYADRTTADRVEKRFIEELFPEHNVVHNGARMLAASMGHRRLYPSASWLRLGQIVKEQRAREHLSQQSVARDGVLDQDTLRRVEAGQSTRYERLDLERLEYGMGWQAGSVEQTLAGGLPAGLTEEQRFLRAAEEFRRLDLMSGI